MLASDQIALARLCYDLHSFPVWRRLVTREHRGASPPPQTPPSHFPKYCGVKTTFGETTNILRFFLDSCPGTNQTNALPPRRPDQFLVSFIFFPSLLLSLDIFEVLFLHIDFLTFLLEYLRNWSLLDNRHTITPNKPLPHAWQTQDSEKEFSQLGPSAGLRLRGNVEEFGRRSRRRLLGGVKSSSELSMTFMTLNRSAQGEVDLDLGFKIVLYTYR